MSLGIIEYNRYPNSDMNSFRWLLREDYNLTKVSTAATWKATPLYVFPRVFIKTRN